MTLDTDLTPATDLALAVPSRLVTINVATMTEGPIPALWSPSVTFTLVGDIHSPTDRVIIAAYTPVTVDLSGDGSGTVRLPVWDGRTGTWAIEVRKSWAPYPYMIRVPAGSGIIDLSQIAPLLVISGGIVEGAQSAASGVPSGGVTGDVLTVSPTGVVWSSLADAYDSARFDRWTPQPRIDRANNARYNAFPVAAQMSNGTVVLAWQDNETHYGGATSTGRVAISTDDGVTFSAPYEPLSPVPAQNQYYVPVGIGVHDNRVALLHWTRPDTSPVPQRREGWVTVTTNPSAKANWSAPVRVEWGLDSSSFPCSLAWVDDGTANGVMLACAYGGAGVMIARSTDAGQTWLPRSTPLPPGVGWSEAAITQVGTRLLMMVRNDSDNTIAALWSSDWGVTWSAPYTALTEASGLPVVTLMRNGDLLVTLRDKVGLGYDSWTLGRSRDGGKTWSKQVIDSSWMMYGQVVQLASGDGLLAGASNTRGSTTDSDVWTRRLTLAPASVVSGAEVDRLRAQLATPTSFAPTLSVGGTAITIGNGSIAAQFTQVGSLTTAEYAIVLGSTSTWGTGDVQLTLPVPSAGWLTAEGSTSLAVRLIGARRASSTVVTLSKPGANLQGTDLAAGELIVRITYRAS